MRVAWGQLEEWGERSGHLSELELPLQQGCPSWGSCRTGASKGNPHLLLSCCCQGTTYLPAPLPPRSILRPSGPEARGTAEHLLSELPHWRKSKWSSCPERLSEQPRHRATGFKPLLFHSEKGNSH